MRNKTAKLNIEKVLNCMHLEPLDERVLQSAKKRVWNQLSHSINTLETQNTMPQIESQTPETNFWKKYKKSFAILSVSALVILSTTGTLTYMNLTKEDKANKELVKTPNKPGDLKTAAAARFKELTGLTLDEYNKQVETTEATNAQLDTNRVGNLATTNLSAPNTRIALPQATKTFYNEYEVVFEEIAKTISDNSNLNYVNGAGYVNLRYPAVDRSKPIKTKSWTNGINGKNVVTQDGKLLFFSTYNEKSAVNYMTGKYAVKTNYNNDGVNAFITTSAIYSGNPEVEFIKYLLAPESANYIKEIGKETRNGVELTIFQNTGDEFAINYDTDKIETRYFVDLTNFSLVSTEFYSGNQKYYTINKLAFAENDDTSFSNDLTELTSQNIEIKEATMEGGMYTAMPVQEISAVNFNKKYPVITVKGVEIENPGFVDVESEYRAYEEQEVVKLTNNKDFDPLFSPSSTETVYNASYVISSPKALYVSINKKAQDKSSQVPLQAMEADKPSEVKRSESTITVNLNGQKISAKKMIGEFDSTKSIEVEFFYNGYYYIISNQGLPGVNQNILDVSTLELTALTQEQLVALDQKIQAIKDNTPKTDYTENLNDVPKEYRLLAGDLSAQGFNLNGVETALKGTTNCDIQTMDTFTSSCFISKAGGVGYSYNDSNTGRYVELRVLNLNETQALDLIKKYNAYWNTASETVFETRALGNKTLLISAPTRDAQNIDLKSILAGVSQDKDLNVLQKQIDESRKQLIEPMMQAR